MLKLWKQGQRSDIGWLGVEREICDKQMAYVERLKITHVKNREEEDNLVW